MPSVINTLTVAELTRRFRAMPNAVLVDFTGLKAGQADALRARLRQSGADMLVVKNSLAARALGDANLGAVTRLLVGPVAFVYGENAPALTKLLRDWSRKERVLSWRGAVVEGEVIDSEGVEALALLPPVHVLHAQVAGAVGAPLTQFLGALQGILRNVVGVVKAIAEKQEGHAPSEPPAPVGGEPG